MSIYLLTVVRIHAGEPLILVRKVSRLINSKSSSSKSSKAAKYAGHVRLRLPPVTAISGPVETLRSDSVTPQRGLKWRTSSVHRILRNRDYIGEAVYNRTKPGKDGRRGERPESEWIRIQIPAIIDRTTFERAQTQLLRNGQVLSGRNDHA
jgi:hypothetical protein